MKSIYVTDIETVTMNGDNSKKPRDRYIDYYRDLQHLYNQEITIETFHQGGQHIFAEMGGDAQIIFFHSSIFL